MTDFTAAPGPSSILEPKPVRTKPFPPWPFFDDDDIAAATAVLRSGRVNYWTGTETATFEAEYAARCGTRYAVALSNGTVALELALRAGGVGPGDQVVVPARTFIATASAVVAVGAEPVVADIDPESQCLTADTVDAVRTSRTRAVIAVHLAGWTADMAPLMALAARHDLLVVEDCAQAHGATYRGVPAGRLGHVAAWSFCQDKIMTTAGEGGMVTTDDEALWQRCWEYKDHGKSFPAVQAPATGPGFRWVHDSFGTNARLTEIQAAVGRAALRKLDGWVATRRRHAARLAAGLAEHPELRLTTPGPEVGHAYYRYYAFVRPDSLPPGWDRDRIMAAIREQGVPVQTGSCGEIYLEKAFPPQLRPAERLPVARDLSDTSLCFLVHPTLTTADVDDTITAVRRVLQRVRQR